MSKCKFCSMPKGKDFKYLIKDKIPVQIGHTKIYPYEMYYGVDTHEEDTSNAWSLDISMFVDENGISAYTRSLTLNYCPACGRDLRKNK